MNEHERELSSLQLLRDMHGELRDALNSLGGRERGGLLERYIVYSAIHINRAVEGFIFLRESNRLDASKLLVRTALEAGIRVHALRKKPELLFRIAFTEFEEDKKWVRPRSRSETVDPVQVIDREWQKFRTGYHTNSTLLEKELR